MELWFWAAVLSGIFSGLAGFVLKLVAKRGYSSEAFVFYSAIYSTIVLLPLAILLEGSPYDAISAWALGLAFFGGFIAGLTGIFKVYALRYIDTTIYFPLFKLVSPLIAIILGVVLFGERFNFYEWLGLLFALFVPLLLINNTENARQQNLFLGLMFVLLTGFLAAIVAFVNNYVVDKTLYIWWIAFAASCGVLLSAIIMMLYRSGYQESIVAVKSHFNKKVLWWSFLRSITISAAFIFSLGAFLYGGDLGIVYSIQSLYILIPIILAIIFYNEHWNLQKVVAIILSVVALALFQ